MRPEIRLLGNAHLLIALGKGIFNIVVPGPKQLPVIGLPARPPRGRAELLCVPLLLSYAVHLHDGCVVVAAPSSTLVLATDSRYLLEYPSRIYIDQDIDPTTLPIAKERNCSVLQWRGVPCCSLT